MKYLWIALLGVLVGCSSLDDKDTIDSLIESGAIRLEATDRRGANYKIVMPTTAPETILTPLLGDAWDVKFARDRHLLISEILKRENVCGGNDFAFEFIDANQKVEYFSGPGYEKSISVYHAYIHLECKTPPPPS